MDEKAPESDNDLSLERKKLPPSEKSKALLLLFLAYIVVWADLFLPQPSIPAFSALWFAFAAAKNVARVVIVLFIMKKTNLPRPALSLPAGKDLVDGLTVDVTRNLTVRHSRRLGSDNANANAEITRFVIGSVPVVDLDLDQLDEHTDQITWHEFDANGEAHVVVDPGRTYFARVRFAPETYTSPYDDASSLAELGNYRWFYYRLDAPGSGHQLFADDEGEEAEAWDLDEDVRLLPPGGASRFRLTAVVRDDRVEWARYHAVPGQNVAEGVVVFAPPQ